MGVCCSLGAVQLLCLGLVFNSAQTRKVRGILTTRQSIATAQTASTTTMRGIHSVQSKNTPRRRSTHDIMGIDSILVSDAGAAQWPLFCTH